MSTPSVNNYVLGRGSLYWSPYDPETNTYSIERHLGNAKEVTIAMGITKLDHFSSMAGLKAKDKTVVSQVAPTMGFTLEEFDEENWKLLTYGTAVTATQTGDDENSVVVASPVKGQVYELGARAIQTKRVTIGAVTGGPFQAGETITGGTSSATAKILQVLAGVLIVGSVTGTFQAAETITGGTSSATASLSTIPTAVVGLVVAKTTSGSTYYTSSDFTVNAGLGQISIPLTSTITGSVTFLFGTATVTYTTISALTKLAQEGKLRFASNNPEGSQYELTAWRTQVSPDGDTALIGDDWGSMKFTAEILNDSVNHPTSPYMDLIVT
jgi:hypothetical protein